jgi:4-hydroxy-3-methylbut-2-enyl diphosphate reductase IspH
MEQERIAKLEAQVESMQEDVKEMRTDIKDLHSRVTTQTREIVDKMDDMQTRLENRMNLQAEMSKQQHNEMKNELQNDVKQISERVDVLERWRWMIVGGAVVLGYIVGHMDLIATLIGSK